MHRYIAIFAVLVVSGCAFTPKNCLRSVATAELIVREAARTTTRLNESKDITLAQAEDAQRYIGQAFTLLEDAPQRCISDEKGAFHILSSIDTLVDKATDALRKDEE